jgi:D-beta-D-heptose 7-phosphate kinase/D-beta-D-heptose 1-phosphate adenosyltransferase
LNRHKRELIGELNLSDIIDTAHNLDHEQKIRSFGEMPKIIRDLGRAGKTVFLAQGVFDIVHAGHVGLIRAIRRLDTANGVVVVGVENDETVRRNKGDRRPVNPLDDRLQVLAEFMSAAYVFGYDDVPTYNRPEDYLDRYRELGSAVVVAASWDPHRDLKAWQASEVGAQVAYVDYRHENSTTRMLRSVGYEE